MKKHIFLLYIIFLISINLKATKIYTSDITNFWIAFDSVNSTVHNELKIKFITDLYINKATKGLNELISTRKLTAEGWLIVINKYPKFWKSIRNKTLAILENKEEIEEIMGRYKKLYPKFKQPDIYFTVGCLTTGGTTSANQILIGTEIAAGDSTVDSSELIPFFKKYFKFNNNIVQMVAHEIVHTQQNLKVDSLPTLLSKCLMEGSSDLITEIVLNKPYKAVYIEYGDRNKLDLLKKFSVDCKTKDYSNWLYNYNTSNDEPADLGYYMGYILSKEYYNNSKNEKKALKEIIELNWLDNGMLNRILSLTMKRNGL